MMPKRPDTIAGNMLIYLLGAIFLLGILIVLLKGNFQEGSGIDGEGVAIKATEVQRYAAELERGVNFILSSGQSENAIRFAHPDSTINYGLITDLPNRQVFSPSGGGVEYKKPPAGINEGTQWQFFATTHIQNMGTNTAASSRAELIAVLPNVTDSFCTQINRAAGQTVDIAATSDSGTCLYLPGSEFTGGVYTSGAGNNTIDAGLFSRQPVKEGCVRCTSGKHHYFRVLLSR